MLVDDVSSCHIGHKSCVTMEHGQSIHKTTQVLGEERRQWVVFQEDQDATLGPTSESLYT